MGLQPDEAEKIGLLAAILGWQIEPHDAVGRGVGRVRSWVGGFPDAFGGGDPVLPLPIWAGAEVGVNGGSANGGRISPAWSQGGWAQGDPGQGSGAERRVCSPRLVLRQTDTVIQVDADDVALMDQLARQGLDRLVVPLSLSALEELLAFAG